MGDVLAAAPVVRSELDKGRLVTLLVYPQLTGFIRLLDFGPASDRLTVEVLPKSRGSRGMWQLFRQLANLSPTLVLISPHAPSPAASWKVPLLMWICRFLFWPQAILAGAKSEPLSALFDKRFQVNRELPLTAREWSLYRQACPNIDGTPTDARFKSSMYSACGVEPEFDLIIHPGATAPNRKWPLEHYAELMRLLPADFRIAIVGLPSDLEPLRQIIQTERDTVFISGTLEEAITSLGRARVAMTMDSGSMFFANMLGVPTVALFGPSAPQFVIPERSNILPIYEQSLPCQPCRDATCRIGTIECMTRIAPGVVARRLIRAIEASKNREL